MKKPKLPKLKFLRTKYFIIPATLIVIGGMTVGVMTLAHGSHTYDYSLSKSNQDHPNQPVTSGSTTSPTSSTSNSTDTSGGTSSSSAPTSTSPGITHSSGTTAQPTNTSNATTVPTACSSYSSQMAALNGQMNQLLASAPNFGNLGSTPGGATAAYAAWTASIAPQEASINKQISSLNAQYPNC